MGDSTGTATGSSNHQWYQKNSGGFTIYTSSNLSTWMALPANTSIWTCSSDRNAKENIEEVDTNNILSKLNKITIYNYKFKESNPNYISTGPMAQDWNKIFPSSKYQLGVCSGDVLGVALASLQELIKEEAELQIKINDIESENESLENLLNSY